MGSGWMRDPSASHPPCRAMTLFALSHLCLTLRPSFLSLSDQLKLVVTQDRDTFGSYVKKIVALRSECLVPPVCVRRLLCRLLLRPCAPSFPRRLPSNWCFSHFSPHPLQNEIKKIRAMRLQHKLEFQNRHESARPSQDGDLSSTNSSAVTSRRESERQGSPGSFGPKRDVLVRTLSFDAGRVGTLWDHFSGWWMMMPRGPSPRRTQRASGWHLIVSPSSSRVFHDA